MTGVMVYKSLLKRGLSSARYLTATTVFVRPASSGSKSPRKGRISSPKRNNSKNLNSAKHLSAALTSEYIVSRSKSDKEGDHNPSEVPLPASTNLNKNGIPRLEKQKEEDKVPKENSYLIPRILTIIGISVGAIYQYYSIMTERDKLAATVTLDMDEHIEKIGKQTLEVNELSDFIDDPIFDKFENIPAVVLLEGPTNVGKTTNIVHSLKEMQKEGKLIIYIRCRSKQNEDISSVIQKQLKLKEKDSIEDVYTALIKNKKQTVIVIDDAQNLIESKVGSGICGGFLDATILAPSTKLILIASEGAVEPTLRSFSGFESRLLVK